MADNPQPLVRKPGAKAVNPDPPNAFIGREETPDDASLEAALGSLKPVWDSLLTHLAEKRGVDGQVWRSYSIKNGWALRLLKKKRTIVWMAPFVGSFQVVFILGERAMAAARQAGLPERTLAALDAAPKYPEGTGVRLHIKGPKDIPAVKKLVIAKLEN